MDLKTAEDQSVSLIPHTEKDEPEGNILQECGSCVQRIMS